MASDERPSETGRRRRLARRPPLLERWLSRFGGGAGRHSPAETGGPGTAENVAAELVDQAEAFASLRVGDVMTPRADIAGLELSTPLLEAVQRFAENEHSRMPVYRESLDDPVGVAHIKDIFKLIAPTGPEAPGAPGPAWGEAVLSRVKRPVLYVPASMRAADLLVRMRAGRIHMAMIIDEYGGVDGLVTMEDLIEAVVGEIDDEHDVETSGMAAGPAGALDSDARTPLEEVEARLGSELSPPEEGEEIDTIGGLVVALAGRLPQRGEVIVHPSGFEFEVLDADPRRIRRLRIRRPAPVAAEDPSS